MQEKNFFKRLISSVLVISLILSLSITFTSCLRDTSKDLIRENIAATLENDTENNSYVFLYLFDWEMPAFDTQKVFWVEELFYRYYNVKEGLPKTLDHAVLTANHFLDNHYDLIDKGDKNAVTEALIDSYITVIGDPYSVYRSPEENVEYDQNLSGSFGGIGVTVEYDHQKKTVMVSAVNIGSPAETAGISVGDYIVGVDGKSIDEIGYDKMVSLIRGEVGTEVTVSVKRGEKLLDFTMTRFLVNEKTVSYSLSEDGIGYIRITQFIRVTYAQFTEAVDYMKENGARGVIFDVRSNPGGLLDTVIAMMSYLLPSDKVIVSYQYKGDDPVFKMSGADKYDEETGKGVDSTLDIPMVVLCNEYSASAAEIFTSVIRDHRNDGLLDAAIVGTTTYKKGIMQASFQHPDDGSLLTITVAYYNPPSGENYHGVGITPDVYVELPELKEGENTVEDTQLNAGIEELEKLINANNTLQ